jgi:outer membrane immunogenic protein
MKKQLIITFTAAASLLSFPLKADDNLNKWNGFYGGVNVGYASGTNHVDSLNGLSNTNLVGGEGSFSPLTDHISGGFGGAQAGYNFQKNRFVYGIEADIQKSHITGGANTNIYTNACEGGCSGSAPSGAQNLEQKINWFSTIRGRFGYSIENILLYGTAGLALADVKADITNYSGGTNTGSYLSDSRTQFGWTVGAGVEWMIYKNWILDAQYLRISLNKEDFHFQDNANSINLINQNNSDFNAFKIGINYKF